MNMILKIISALFLGALAGCATIMGAETHNMPISSTPSDAMILITEEKGMEVFRGNTPTNVTLKKSDGTYFGKKSYTVTPSKNGYGTQTVPVKGGPSSWYIMGNAVFGGLLGWLLIDPLNGKMYNLSPESINTVLPTSAKTAHNNKAADGSITIMLTEQVPTDLRGKMQLIR